MDGCKGKYTLGLGQVRGAGRGRGEGVGGEVPIIHTSQGVGNVLGCYGGTAAPLNCAAWVESSAWDGRWAIAAATDVAVYAPDCPQHATSE